MAEEYSIRFKIGGESGHEITFDEIINDPEKLNDMTVDDFAALDASIQSAFEEPGFDRVLYYFKYLQSWDYVANSCDKTNEIVKKYIERYTEECEKNNIEPNSKVINPANMTEIYIKISKKIGYCASNSWNYFKVAVQKCLLEIGEIIEGENDEPGNWINSGNLMPYFWYKHKRHFDNNPISLSVFYTKERVKVAIELASDKAAATHIKELFVEKLNEVISITKDPESYGFKSNEFDEVWCVYIPDESEQKEGKYTGSTVKKAKDLTDNDIKNNKKIKGRYQFFVINDEDDDIENINVGLEYLLKLYDKISYSSIYKREIYKTIQKRKMKQMVFNGAPGTGKTFGIQKYIEEITADDKTHERWKIIQFHPSYDYSDFVEGIRPISIKDKDDKVVMSFVKIDGEFKKFCRSVVNDRLDKLITDGYLGSVSTPLDDSNRKNAFDELKRIFDKKRKIEQGKTDGYKPEELTSEELEKEQKVIDCFNAIDGDNENYYYFIIDEINRADISKVFGELMYAFEYRGMNKRIPTQYSQLNITYEKENNEYSPIGFDCFEDGFFIPENVVVIGTMNDIDKSVESFDFAMRRRFQWIRVNSKDVMMDVLLGMLCKNDDERIKKIQDVDSIRMAINNMNDTIVTAGEKYGLTSDYHIGPSYFKNCDLNSKIKQTLSDQFDLVVEPTLREYVRGRAEEKKISDFIKECHDALLAGYNKAKDK